MIIFDNRSFAYRAVLGGFALLIAIELVPGLRFEGGALNFILLALIFGLVNAVLKPLLQVLSCPFVLMTLGFFLLVLNALLLMLTASLGRTIGIPFTVDNFGSAFIGGILISIVSFIGTFIFPERRR
jgi:putative membrane protein